MPDESQSNAATSDAARTDVFHYDGLTYWGPVGVATMESIIDLLRLPATGRALDIGCGKAELLVRLAERFGSEAVGVDKSEAALAAATTAFAKRAPDARFEPMRRDVADLAFDDGSFDLVAWLGGPYLGEGSGQKDFTTTVSRLSRWLRPGGYLLLGHGFWSAPPPADYLAATGIAAGEFGEHWQNIDVGESAGLRSLYSCRSNRDEWDEFEGRILANVEHYAAAHPDAPDPQGRLEQRRSWHKAQQRWGRDAMGFGLYLFMS